MPGDWERLCEKLGDATLVPAAALFREIRVIKTSQEVERLRRAAMIAEQSIAAALAVARQGVSEVDLARAFSRALAQQIPLALSKMMVRLKESG